MKKNIFLSVIIIIFAIVFYFETIDAQVPTTGNGGLPFQPISSRARTIPSIFAGKITALKASQVENYEGAGYECIVPGRTIEIRPIKGQSSYFIPEGTYSRTNHELNPGQSILGKEQSTQNINCKRCDRDEGGFLQQDESRCTEVNFNIPIITLFGTSRI